MQMPVHGHVGEEYTDFSALVLFANADWWSCILLSTFSSTETIHLPNFPWQHGPWVLTPGPLISQLLVLSLSLAVPRPPRAGPPNESDGSRTPGPFNCKHF